MVCSGRASGVILQKAQDFWFLRNAMASLPPIVAIEIGTTKVRVLVAEVREDEHLMITGVRDQPSRGVRKGEIVHFDNALSCVRTAFDEAEMQSQVTINAVYVLLSGADIQAGTNKGSVPLVGPEQEILPDDIQHVLDTSKAISLATDREILHSIQQYFYVDDQQPVIDPKGMEGSKLSVDMLIVHGVRNRLRNTIKVVRSAHVEVQDVAFSGLCSALAVLTPEQKESGAIVIDLGGGTTDYFVYAEKAVAMAGTIAVGGDHITNDLGLGLGIPTVQAERVKVEHGSAMVDLSVRGQNISLPAEGGFTGRNVKLVDIQTIIHARVYETLSLVRNQLKEKDFLHLIGAGVILTGSGCKLKRIEELVQKVFQLPCHKGVPRNLSGLAVVTEGAEYAACIGMLRYALKVGSKESSSIPIFSMLKGIFRK